MRTKYKANNIGGLTTGAGMAEPHSPPSEEQAVPGLISDKGTFLLYSGLSTFCHEAFKS